MRWLIFFGMAVLFEAFKIILAKNGFRIAGAIPTFVFLAMEFYVCNLVAKKSYFKREMNKL